MKRILQIENLDCPVCAEALQSDLMKLKGIREAKVDYLTQTIALEYDDDSALQRAIKKTNKFEEVRVIDGGMSATKRQTRVKEWLEIGVAAVLLAVAILLGALVKNQAGKILSYCVYGAAYLAVGYPVLISTVKNICKGRIFDENFLMTVASIGAVALGEWTEGVVVMLLYQLGELLQSIAVGSSRQSVTELMALKSERATRLVDGEWQECRPEELLVGDTVLVKAGEKAPADGVLLTENALLDMKSLTGESQPKEAACGEEILSGSINAGGVYELKVVRPYEDSAVGRILEMVENAAAGKAKPEKFIAKFAKVYTPAVCLLALLLAFGAPLISGLAAGKGLYFQDVGRWVHSALTFLVISCPCALVISVPLTYFSGIGACAKRGILVKGATYLDIAAKVKTVAFDKTGTLTEGNFTIRAVKSSGEVSKREVLLLAATLEKCSAHPIAKAFDGVKSELVAEQIVERLGRGISATVCGEKVLVGSEKLLLEEGVEFERTDSAYTLVYVAREGRYLGVVEIGDIIREEAKEALARISALGIERTIVLTGDNQQRANTVGKELGIDEVRGDLLPDEKLEIAADLKKKGGLLYVGDGINDAPVMMTADCAVSMGKLGSAAAIEASDLVLISDDLKAIPKALSIAKKTRKIVTENIVFSILMKVTFMALGAAGILPLCFAVFADVGVMLLAVFNSFRARG